MRISASKVAVTAAISLVPLLGGASMATAGSTGAQVTDCPSDGYITRGDRCTTLSNGYLSIHLFNTGGGVSVVYRKNGGSTVTAKLGYLRSGNTNYKAPQSMPAGQEFNALWSGLANPCYPTNGLLYSGGTTYQTPAAIPSRC